MRKMRSPQNEKYVNVFNEYLKQQGTSVTDNPVGIEKILNEFNDTNKYQVNFHWSKGGWMTFENCKLNKETLEINFDSFKNLVKPIALETFYFPNDPDFSFMRLSYQGLEPSGVNENYEFLIEEIGHEEYVRVGEKNYPRDVLDRVSIDYDNYLENENYGKKFLPDNTEAILRELRDGQFMIVSKGSVLNSSKFEGYMKDIAKKGIDSKYFPQIELIH